MGASSLTALLGTAGPSNSNQPPHSPGELADLAEEEERQLLARLEARCGQAKATLKQTELPGSRQSAGAAQVHVGCGCAI